MIGDESTLTPFGRAFYKKDAAYSVHPLGFIVAYSVLAKIAIAVFHTLPLLGALHATAAFFYGLQYNGRSYDDFSYSTRTVFFSLLGFFIITHALRIFAWLIIEWWAKWGLL